MLRADHLPRVRAARVIIEGTGRIKIITVDYREAPEAKFPAASEDVTAVYRELLKSYAPENIAVIARTPHARGPPVCTGSFIAMSAPGPSAVSP
jgi:monoterpene epsilon-lactone hydrolase